MRAGLLAAALLASAPVAAQEAAPALPAIKPIAFTQRTLPNGLRVYAIRDTTTPNVAVQVWYDVGGRDDPRGRSGFAHLFEHLMFKATRNLVPEQFDRLTEDVGGYNNASTGDDYTNYYEVVPANHLQRLLFAEADRMASLVVEPRSFASERDVVKEEFRQGVLAQPYGKLYSLYLPAITYQRHPYARGVIGSIADLDAATIEDVRAFHATYYRPDNAILVVAGNFDPATLDRWVDSYFGSIARPDRPVPRVTVDEPVRAKPVAVTIREPNTPLPAVAISLPLPPDAHPDIPALMVLDAILSRGESSRLYRRLVAKDALAQSANTILDARKGPGMYALVALAAGGKDIAAVEAALNEEVARVRDTPVDPAELAEAKTEILTSAITGLETAEGKARMLAASVLIDGDPRATERQLDAVRAVTVADVQRVARTWLAPDRMATIRYLPAAEGTPAGPAISVAKSVETRPLVAIATDPVVPATASERIALPPLGPAVSPAMPRPVTETLANGLTVITVEKHDVPLVAARLVALGGASRDPANKAGTAALTAELLTKGTKTRDAAKLAADAEALGASLAGEADRDGMELAMTVATPSASAALAILADTARNTALADSEFAAAQARAIDAAGVAMSDPAAVAAMVGDRLAHGATPAGMPVGGTAASLKAVTQADVRAAYAGSWTPASTALVITGDLSAAQAKAMAETAFGNWRGEAPTPAPLPKAGIPTPRAVVVDMPDAGQAGVVVAAPSLRRADPDYYPALVAGTVLGGGFSSRLNQEIRIKRGLSYGARAGLDAGRATGTVRASTTTKNPSAPEVVSLIRQEMTRLGTQPLPADAELESRKSVLVGGFGRRIETVAGLGATVADYRLTGISLDTLETYIPSVRAVTAEQVQSAAASAFDPAKASVVVVGDARQFLEPLRATTPGLSVVPVATLDLSRDTLGATRK